MEEIRNIKELAKVHIPQIHEILSGKEKFWKRLQKKFETKINSAIVGTESETSIPLLLGRAELQEEIAITILNFIDNIVEDLRNKIPSNLNTKFENMVSTMVQEFDKQLMPKPNPTYLNFLAEILAISKLLNYPDYQLVNFETKMANNKNVDFELIGVKGKTSYVDVVNIHISEEDAKNYKNLNKIIDGKLDDKVASKFGGTDMNDKFILPIFWFNNSILKEIKNYINSAELEKRNIIPPCSLTFYSEDTPYFGTII